MDLGPREQGSLRPGLKTGKGRGGGDSPGGARGPEPATGRAAHSARSGDTPPAPSAPGAAVFLSLVEIEHRCPGGPARPVLAGPAPPREGAGSPPPPQSVISSLSFSAQSCGPCSAGRALVPAGFLLRAARIPRHLLPLFSPRGLIPRARPRARLGPKEEWGQRRLFGPFSSRWARRVCVEREALGPGPAMNGAEVPPPVLCEPSASSSSWCCPPPGARRPTMNTDPPPVFSAGAGARSRDDSVWVLGRISASGG